MNSDENKVIAEGDVAGVDSSTIQAPEAEAPIVGETAGELPEGGESGEGVQADSEGEQNAGTDGAENTAPSTEKDWFDPATGEAVEVETAKYRITGLVDYMDETGNIVGQLEVGSEQELPVEYGDRQVEAGQAERV